MGGAFVAVASDSSATWWNPAGLAAGPFLDLALARARLEGDEALPAWRETTSGVSLATPPFGVSYYRFRITDIRPFSSTDTDVPGREDGRAGVSARSLSASHLGVTTVQTLVPGVHAGATLKYVRGTVRTGGDDAGGLPSDLLDRGDALTGGSSDGHFDLDVGVLAVAGVIRLGAVVRNVREPEIGSVRLPRQVRLGVAFHPEPVTDLPLTVSLDADAKAYTTASGLRRVVAVGAEQWFFEERLGVRGGGRLNTVGAQERTATAGVSVAVRPGMFVDAHVARGSSPDETGWGVAARVSF